MEWFPPERFPFVCQDIFKHFGAKDLLELSLVNKRWNDFVAGKRYVGKLELKIDKTMRKLSREDKKILLNSNRKYQHIKFEFVQDDLEFLLPFLANRAGSWKSVWLSAVGPIATAKWPEIFEIVASSVEELYIKDQSYIEESSTPAMTWWFPHLKHLNCSVRYNVFKHFIHVTSLVKFHWVEWTWGSTLDIRTILHNNHNLKDMRGNIDLALFDPISEIKFKLQKLDLYDETDDPAAPYFPFLKTQAETLESLDFSLELDQPLVDLILNMPRLTSLSAWTPILDATLEVPVNTTITSLEVWYQLTGDEQFGEEDITADERTAYQNLIRAVRNLKHFKCYEIDVELLRFLAQNVPALESLETRFFNVTRIPEGIVFPNIKKFKAMRFREDFEEPSDNFASLVKNQFRLIRDAR